MSDMGWISIHRKLGSHWLWEAKPFSYGQAWIDILLECNHRKRKQLIKGQLIETDRGQSSNSLKTWANRFGWSISATRHFLDLLVKDGMIRTDSARVTTLLMVCNYDSYQHQQHAEGSQEDRREIAEGSQGIDKQQLDNGNNENKGKRKRFTKPTYNDVSIYMSSDSLTNRIDVSRATYEAQKFMNHYDSNGWRVGKNPMRDWKASVRNWLLNIKDAEEKEVGYIPQVED